MVTKLAAIANKAERLILGMMSGTSLDGLDLALCRVRGTGKETQLTVLHFKTITYTATIRSDIRAVFAQETVSMAKLSALHASIGALFAECALLALEEWSLTAADVDLIASHGQTIFHAPQPKDSPFPNNTLQIGDGDHIAVKTGIITISDFRQKHVAGGGEGAPLVVYGDQMLFTDDLKDRFLINIGGIANFTFLPCAKKGTFPLATDTGPGNTLMNQYMLHHFDEPFDKNGQLATAGQVNQALLEALLSHPFFLQAMPKTTGPELFNLAYLHEAMHRAQVTGISHPDVLATLCAFTAKGLATSMLTFHLAPQQTELFISGGGIHNPCLMAFLRKELMGYSIQLFDRLGIPPDAKEAALFALLANETVAGNSSNMIGGPGAPRICLGKISLPA